MQELRRLLSLAWPVLIGQLGGMALGVVDLLMIGRLGDNDMAALSIANVWSFGLVIIGMGTLMGVDPLFAQSHGAGEPKAVGRTLLRALVVSQLLALPITALHFLAGPALTLLGQPAETVPIAAAYCGAVAWSIPALMAFFAIKGFLQGMELMRPAAVVVVLANVANVFANEALIFGLGGAPALGTVGCGWATTWVRIGMLPLLLWLSWEPIQATWAGWRGVVTGSSLRRMFSLGLPVGLQSAMEVEAFNAVILMMGLFGATALAGNAIALNLASISFMVPLSVGAAAATRIGNLVGAELPWERAAWTAVGLGVTAMSVSALLFLTLPEPLARLYTSDGDALRVAVALLPLAAGFQIFDGVQVVTFGVLRGAGDTRWPALANAVGYWLIGLPLGGWLAFRADFGPKGIWVGLIAGLFVVASLLLARLRWLMGRGAFRVAEEDAA